MITDFMFSNEQTDMGAHALTPSLNVIMPKKNEVALQTEE